MCRGRVDRVHGEQAWKTPDPIPESFPGYDALSIYTFGSREVALAAFTSPEGLLVEQDTGKFMDWPSVLSIPTEAIGRFDANPA